MLTVDFREIALREGMRVLDAGCGSGRHLCEAFRTPGAAVAGVDLNWGDLCKAKGFLSLMAGENGGTWIVARADVTKLPFADGCFDVVVCAEVLEHIAENRAAVGELLRVLKPGGDLVVTVPRFLPERICWMLSSAYHREPGGHIRIYKKAELRVLLEEAGASCRRIRYRHGLHAPYWWLRCLVGHKNESFPMVRAYRKFLEWDIIRHPRLTSMLDRILNPLIGKSIVFYLKKGCR
ncbi:MAG: class I SAM-dependent methyltransferase [Proteobacteria bacterium]|nr:class I SAM-dependent methyltransferase [Pseudomonadota bacterium]MBU2226675.1 class I SAM-dependent methyltransferase [Pseudomonadota bacterium]MBU2261064.1 class I SAM-dependent methyltransferase [Pseudomonadota bacterium]